MTALLVVIAVILLVMLFLLADCLAFLKVIHKTMDAQSEMLGDLMRELITKIERKK